MTYPASKPNSYISGAGVRVFANLTDLSGNATDPVGVALNVRDPAGTITPYTGNAVVRDGVGAYHVDLNPVMAGHWFYRWSSTNQISAQEGEFRVNESKVFEDQ